MNEWIIIEYGSLPYLMGKPLSEMEVYSPLLLSLFEAGEKAKSFQESVNYLIMTGKWNAPYPKPIYGVFNVRTRDHIPAAIL